MHMHEIPNIYTQRIVNEWMEYFSTGEPLLILGLAPKGERMP